MPIGKFEHPDKTADGSPRATVALKTLETLWINTGTLCNVECAHCYIESSPTNDALVYINAQEAASYIDDALEMNTKEIAFTGGEPFMNPDFLAMLGHALERAPRALILTNAMRPMMRPKIQDGLLQLKEKFGDRLCVRVSVDHFSAARHDQERGIGSFKAGLAGIRWLNENGFNFTIAGRTCWNEEESDLRLGFADLFKRENINLDANNIDELILFPEMDEQAEPPEITQSCWGMLGMSPTDIMCASSRMIVKRKGAEKPAVIACTLLPYEAEFELGQSLKTASKKVSLNHPHCATFCVLGGANCSG